MTKRLLQILFPNKWGGTNYYHYEHRVRMVIFNIIDWFKLSKIFLTFWKLPRAIQGFNSAVNFAKHEIKDLREVIERKDDQVDTLIAALIEEYTRNQMSPKEAHREVYQMTYYDKWVNRIPSQYLTEKEADDKFDRDLDNYVTADPIANAGYQELMDYELYELKKGGIYETSY